jgi:hypothetical protein
MKIIKQCQPIWELTWLIDSFSQMLIKGYTRSHMNIIVLAALHSARKSFILSTYQWQHRATCQIETAQVTSHWCHVVIPHHWTTYRPLEQGWHGTAKQEGNVLISLPFAWGPDLLVQTALLHVQRNVLKDKIIRKFESGGLRRKGLVLFKARSLQGRRKGRIPVFCPETEDQTHSEV